jgi:hypothetical protein
MAKIYTTKTPSLKATLADVRELDARKITLNGENIKDLWGFSNETDYPKLMKRYTLPQDEPYILWSDKGSPLFISFAEEITNGSEMFSYHSSIDGFDISLPNLTDGTRMFALCDNLKFVHADFPKLINVPDMFLSCLSLEEYKGDLSALTYGQNMFQNCYSMKKFEGDTPLLQNGLNMFNGCPLVEFKGNLRKLHTADNMFKGAKMNKESVLHILSELRSASTLNGTLKMTLGIDKTLQTDTDIKTELGGITPIHGQTISLGLGNNIWDITIQLN